MPDCREFRETFEERRRGELPDTEARLLDAHLAACLGCRDAWQEDERLTRLVQGLVRTPAPAALRRRLHRLALPDERRGWRAWRGRPAVAAAVAALVVALVLSPWVLRRESPPDPVELLIASGVTEHRRILLELQSAPREVQDATAAFSAVRAHTDIQLAPVFAGDDKLRLLVAAPTLLANRKAAAATLGYKSGTTATYFVLVGKELAMPQVGRVQIEQYRPYMRRVDDFHVIYWKQADLAYLMVADFDEAHTRQVFLKMRNAL